MSEYRLNRDGSVKRLRDGAHIPAAPGNRDWLFYQDWLAAGGVQEPAGPARIVPPTPSVEDRIIALESDVARLKGRP